MADEVTGSGDVIVPAVWSQMVQAEFAGKLVMAQFAQTDDTLVGQPGDTVRFPKWNAIGAAQRLGEGVPIETRKLSSADATATIQEIGNGVSVYDRSRLVALGDPLGESVRQLAITLTRQIDSDLASVLKWKVGDAALPTGLVAEGSPFAIGGATATFNIDLIFDGITAFGDDVEVSDINALLVHTNEYRKLLSTGELLTADVVGGPGTALKGFVGTVAGIPVIRVDRGMVAGKSVMVTGSPLQLLYKRRPITETERIPKLRRTDVYTSVHYGLRRASGETVAVLESNPA